MNRKNEAKNALTHIQPYIFRHRKYLVENRLVSIRAEDEFCRKKGGSAHFAHTYNQTYLYILQKKDGGAIQNITIYSVSKMEEVDFFL